MTRRERLTNKLTKRQEWAEKAQARSEQRFEAAGNLADAIPLGQPILVGHHSERHARRDAKRIYNNMQKGCEESKLANYHNQKASGLAIQLDRTIFSDDDNAVEALETRIADREHEAAHLIALNKAWRQAKGNVAQFAKLAAISQATAQCIAEHIAQPNSDQQPSPAWEISNLRANIRRDRERIKKLQAPLPTTS